MHEAMRQAIEADERAPCRPACSQQEPGSNFRTAEQRGRTALRHLVLRDGAN